MSSVALRDATPADIPAFISYHADAQAAQMAAFVSHVDADAQIARWTKIINDPDTQLCAIVRDALVVGYAGSFPYEQDREITYWVDRQQWGIGIATSALQQLLQLQMHRPLYARVAADNAGSIRVLEKCGFQVIDRITSYAPARAAEIEELVLRIDE